MEREQFTCLRKKRHLVGWSALYDVCMFQILEEGTILVSYNSEEDFLMFELAGTFNLMDDIEVSCVPGSVVECKGGNFSAVTPSSYNLLCATLRFPTKDELVTYERLAGV